ncbi:MAG: hypothetical protein JWQ04_2193 [Pedosphaera sp.]|nr:hypothetical protein [Pedosphaera sp.]
MKGTAVFLVVVLVVGITVRATAQDSPYSYPYPASPPAPSGQILAPSQLDQLLGPIALYPDPLIAQILPAATQPSQIALADNYLASGGDPNLIDQQPWDSSVKAVARYPDVLRYLDSNMGWTSELGQAFLDQPSDVMNSVQRLRAQAQALGNLQTSPQETVINDNGEIDIEPANPEMIYVPQYDPGIIYYQRPYYGSSFLTFGLGFRIGGWLDHDFDWHDHDIVVWGRDHPRPNDYWRRRPEERRREVDVHQQVWRPQERRNFVSPVNRGDRGYENRPVRSEPVRNAPEPVRHNPEPVRRAPEPARPTPEPVRRAPEPARPVPEPARPVPQPRELRPAPAPAPVQVHTIPSRPTSAFNNSAQSAQETRAASSRGAQSRPPSAGGDNGKHR